VTIVKPTNSAALKAERERDKALAMRDYEAEKQAWQANMMRLRALRLARESAATPAAPARRSPNKRATTRGSSPTKARGIRRTAALGRDIDTKTFVRC
jgi:hypothetical protein